MEDFSTSQIDRSAGRADPGAPRHRSSAETEAAVDASLQELFAQIISQFGTASVSIIRERERGPLFTSCPADTTPRDLEHADCATSSSRGMTSARGKLAVAHTEISCNGVTGRPFARR